MGGRRVTTDTATAVNAPIDYRSAWLERFHASGRQWVLDGLWRAACLQAESEETTERSLEWALASGLSHDVIAATAARLEDERYAMAEALLAPEVSRAA